MPIIPRQYEKAWHSQPHDVQGEEGTLYSLRERDEWLKRWTYAHEQGLGIPERRAEASTLSPYWAKLQFYQAKLIHRLFPENTIQLKGAYDARIKLNKDQQREERAHSYISLGRGAQGRAPGQEAGHSFDFVGGKPSTVSRAVDTGHPAAQRYTNIVYPMYQETAPMFEQIRRTPEHALDPELRRRYDQIFDDADVQLHKNVGAPEFTLLQGFIDVRTLEELEAYIQSVEQKIREINPNSPILRFLEAGIAPVHPSLNFIPDAEQNGKDKPAGTFLELKIMHPARFAKHIESQHDARTTKLFERFRLMHSLDVFFTRLFYITAQDQEKAQLLFDPEIATALFRITERIRQVVEKNPEQLEYYCDGAVHECATALMSSRDTSSALAHLRAITRAIKI